MKNKEKHLEFIQATINRMAGNSFLLKGWSVTLAGGLLAFSFKEMDVSYVVISMVILFFFWLLDSYYLSRERHFVKLYENVIKNADTNFSMDTKGLRHKYDWVLSFFSTTLCVFYGGLFLTQIIIIIFIQNYGTKSILQFPL